MHCEGELMLAKRWASARCKPESLSQTKPLCSPSVFADTHAVLFPDLPSNPQPVSGACYSRTPSSVAIGLSWGG